MERVSGPACCIDRLRTSEDLLAQLALDLVLLPHALQALVPTNFQAHALVAHPELLVRSVAARAPSFLLLKHASDTGLPDAAEDDEVVFSRGGRQPASGRAVRSASTFTLGIVVDARTYLLSPASVRRETWLITSRARSSEMRLSRRSMSRSYRLCACSEIGRAHSRLVRQKRKRFYRLSPPPSSRNPAPRSFPSSWRAPRRL